MRHGSRFKVEVTVEDSHH